MTTAAGILGRALVVFIAAAIALPLWAGQDFKMADTLTCTVEAAATPAEIGRKITVSGLTTETPKALFVPDRSVFTPF